MQAQYGRNYPPAPAQRSPAQVRRGPGPMLNAPSATNPQAMAQQQQDDQRRREVAKRQARKPTDKNLPDGLDDVIIGDGVQRYRKLRDVERRMDAVMMRKKLEITDTINRTHTRYRTLRLWISNTAENQPWQRNDTDLESFDFNSDTPARYKVKIEGRLLDEDEGLEEDQLANGSGGQDADAMDTDAPAKPPARNERTKLSRFFKQITIEYDRDAALQDNFNQIEWKKPESRPKQPADNSDTANFDCLTIDRISDENINITIKLYRDDQPERYRLLEPLARLLDTDEEDRAGVVFGVWNYIQEMGLQEDEESRRIKCDETLRAVFGQDLIYFPHIPELIHKQLAPLPPITLKYTIRVDEAYIAPTDGSAPSEPTIYDLLVPVTDPFRAALTNLTHIWPSSSASAGGAPSSSSSAAAAAAAAAGTGTGPQQTPNRNTLAELARLDDVLALAVQGVTHSKAKHAFFTSMANDPAKFINRWVSSQRRDLQVIMGESRGGVGPASGAGYGWDETGGEEWRWGGESGVWGSKGATEAVALYAGRMYNK